MSVVFRYNLRMTQAITAPIETTVEPPAAIVHGQNLAKLPDDLYIPPGALQVFLETFEGPLDLLLYLIRKQNIDILNIPIADITRQYMEYVELMREMHFELAAEYLVMAAMLAEIKSRMLLPRPSLEVEEGEDPRAELIRRLQEYERFKQAAEELEALPLVGRDVFIAQAMAPDVPMQVAQPNVPMDDILSALRDIMMRTKLYTEHQIEREVLSIRERMTILLSAVKSDRFIEFTTLFTAKEGRMGVVVTLIAILELVRQKVIEFVQSEPYSTIYVKARSE
jgi:segregation and condensation protein A